MVVPNPCFPTTRDLPSSGIQRIIDSILNCVYPEECFICAAPVSRRQDFGVCAGCWGKALSMRIMPPRCLSCGIPFQNSPETSDYVCGQCLLKMPPFSGARAFGYYADELSRLIQGLKFHGRRNLAEPLGALLATAFFELWNRDEFDFIVPVPLHARRKRERGFNQSELLAGALARKTAIQSLSALVRIRPTLPQVGLTDSQRAENVRNAFHCADPAPVSGKRILLIDDVMTTGATVASASRVLLRAGALRVSVLTVARVGKW